MTWPGLSIALLLPALLGMAALRLFERRREPFIEWLLLGYGLGSGVIALELFLMGLAGVGFGPWAFVIVLATVAVLSFAARLTGRSSGPGLYIIEKRARRQERILAALLAVWILWKLAFVFSGGFFLPIVSQDAWWNWSAGAKVFYYTGGLLLDPSNEHFFGAGYRPFLSYPLLNPLIQVWVSLCLGDFHEALSKAWAPVFFTASIVLVYFTVKKEGGFFAGLLTAFFLSASPLLAYHALDAYADLPLAFYVLAGSVLLWRYMEGGTRSEAALSGLLFAMAAFTKNEGLVYLAAAALALALYNMLERRMDWKGVLLFIVLAALYIGPWFIFKSHYGIGLGHGKGTGFGLSDQAGGFAWEQTAHLEVIPIFLRELFLSIDHMLVFPFLAVISIIGIKTLRRSNIKYIYLIMAAVAGVFLFDYTFTYDYRYVANLAAPDRNIMTFLPTAFLTAGLLVSRILKEEK